jgi:hypothetical protein
VNVRRSLFARATADYVGDYDQKGLRRLREVKADGKILVLWDAAGPDGGR